MMFSPFLPPGLPSPEELLKLYAETPAVNYAMVRDGIIVNIIYWDGVSPYTPPEGCELHRWAGRMNIGWAWVDGKPVDPDAQPSPPADV